jgi:DNA ligase-1
MRAFAHLLDRLSLTASRNAKLVLLRDYLATTPDPERGYALAAMTGDLSFRAAKPAMIREAVAGRVDAQLFALSYDFVGDLAETAALIWPARPGANRPPGLADVVEALDGADRKGAAALMEVWLDALDADGRWALLKLITGGLRVGLSVRLARQAVLMLAVPEAGPVEIGDLEEIWHGLQPPYVALFAWLEGRGPRPDPDPAGRFRPAMLAHALDEETELDRLTPDVFAAEWKWDGVRVQAVREQGQARLYTRTGEDISAAFPDLVGALGFEGVIDGELVVRRGDALGSFSDLQQRLNRKTASAALMASHPAAIRAYDLLGEGTEDLRPLSFRVRRSRLEAFVARHAGPRLDLSPLQPFDSPAHLATLRAAPPEGDARLAEGLMLKRWDSAYLAGRPKGPWFKWKRDPFLVDAVMLYAQRGHGKRSGLYSDFTFGVWRDGALTPVGKAYFGFTDAELKVLDRFVRENTVETFGPVRRVRAEPDHGVVLEIAFEGLQRSPRHKSGLAMRFPRIHRLRLDKPPKEADDIAVLERLLSGDTDPV